MVKIALLQLVLSVFAGFIIEGFITPIGVWGSLPGPPHEIPLYCLGMFSGAFLLSAALPRMSWIHPIGLFLGQALAAWLLLYVSWPLPHQILLFLLYLPVPVCGTALGWTIRNLIQRRNKMPTDKR